MKAIVVQRLGGPEVLTLAEVPDPQPGAGQVLMRVEAAGVNPVDAYMHSGNYPRKPALPYTPGGDAAGLVLACGAGATRFKPGDRVYAFGTGVHSGAYAQRLVAPENNLQFLPAAATFQQGAALGVPYATAVYALFQRGRSVPGETVLVHGASGGVGIAAVQIARAFGLRVLGTSSSPEGRAAVLAHGAHQVFDHSKAGYFEEIVAAVKGRGLDLVLEMLANVNLERDLSGLAPKGRVVVVGSRGKAEIDPRATMSLDADIRGMSLFNAGPGELAAIHAYLRAGLDNSTLKPVIAEALPLSEAAQAHARVMQNGKIGKIVLLP